MGRLRRFLGAPGLLRRAVEVYDVHRLDFADAYLVASAERTGEGERRSDSGGSDSID